MDPLASIIIIIIFLFSVIIHEISHGFMADFLGDPTPRLAGRLTLNPIHHLDPVGSVLVPFLLIIMKTGFIFGWAKPVPVNPHNFHDQKYGKFKVGIAGISANIMLAIVFGIPVRFLPQAVPFFQNLNIFFAYIAGINLLLAVFNLFPLPPFDGFHVFFSFSPKLEYKMESFQGVQFISFFIAILFILYVGIPYIVKPLFSLITGGKVPLF